MNAVAVKGAWRQRGYSDAVARRGEHPPADEQAAVAYRAGYRHGLRQLEERR